MTITNSDFVIYDKPVHAIASGEVIACWRNAPNNIRPATMMTAVLHIRGVRLRPERCHCGELSRGQIRQ
jgi:hypothetical protein